MDDAVHAAVARGITAALWEFASLYRMEESVAGCETCALHAFEEAE